MVLFWTAFGAVGTTLGSLATAIAVIIAVIQYRQPLVKKLNIRLVSAFHVSRIEAGEHLLNINIANTGIRDIVISNVYLSIGKKKLHFDYQEYGREIDVQMPEFPHLLHPEQGIDLFIPYEKLQKSLQKKSNMIPNKYICISVTDQAGYEYIKNTKIHVKKLLK